MPDKHLPTIGVIGAGRLGLALARALTSDGIGVAALWTRSSLRAASIAETFGADRLAARPEDVLRRSELVFVSVPDDVIETMVGNLPWTEDHAVVHCSGALDRSVLGSIEMRCASTGAFHPLQSFTESSSADPFRDIAVAIEAEEPLSSTLYDLAARLGARPFVISAAARGRYHASAVMASNYLVTLAHEAASLLTTCGLSPTESLGALVPLLRGTVENLAAAGLPAALTGPIARGDERTVARHLDALSELMDEEAALYARLGLRTLPLALARGQLSAAAAARLEQRFTAVLGQERTASCA